MYMWRAIFIDESDFSFSNGHEEYIGVFETEELGVRAHIQHLQAYATTPDIELHKELVDPRYNWVHKTKYIETIYELAGNWATDPQYGQKLEANLVNMENFNY